MVKHNFDSIVFTPAECAANYARWAAKIKDQPGISWGIPAIDKHVIPFRGGDLIAFVGRPGSGKSTQMARFAKTVAEDIRDAGKWQEECVVYVTWEQIVEEIENFFQSSDKYSSTDVAWGRADLDEVKRNQIKRSRLPIFTIGHSSARAGQKKPPMTPGVILDAIRWIEDEYNVKVRLVLMDYIQLIPIRGYRNKMEQVDAAVPEIKNLLTDIESPGIIGVQASRKVDELRFKIPEMNHCQWASAIEQGVDKAYSFWRPYVTEPQGATIDLGQRYGGEQPVEQNMLIMKQLKQRFAEAGQIWPMFFDPSYLKLEAMDLYNARRGGEYGR